MTRTGQAMAAGAAAFLVDENQASGHQGAFGLELFDARLELALDEGGMFGSFHIPRRIADYGLGISDK